MSITKDYVQTLFGYLSTKERHRFFENVAENVSWTVMGTHPLAGHYHSKQDFLVHTFSRLNNLLEDGVILRVTSIYVDNNTAIVEMEALSSAKNGKPFHNTYCWITRFEQQTIVEVRAYLDSALVKQLIEENE